MFNIFLIGLLCGIFLGTFFLKVFFVLADKRHKKKQETSKATSESEIKLKPKSRLEEVLFISNQAYDFARSYINECNNIGVPPNDWWYFLTKDENFIIVATQDLEKRCNNFDVFIGVAYKKNDAPFETSKEIIAINYKIDPSWNF